MFKVAAERRDKTLSKIYVRISVFFDEFTSLSDTTNVKDCCD